VLQDARAGKASLFRAECWGRFFLKKNQKKSIFLSQRHWSHVTVPFKKKNSQKSCIYCYIFFIYMLLHWRFRIPSKKTCWENILNVKRDLLQCQKRPTTALCWEDILNMLRNILQCFWHSGFDMVEVILGLFCLYTRSLLPTF